MEKTFFRTEIFLDWFFFNIYCFDPHFLETYISKKKFQPKYYLEQKKIFNQMFFNQSFLLTKHFFQIKILVLKILNTRNFFQQKKIVVLKIFFTRFLLLKWIWHTNLAHKIKIWGELPWRHLHVQHMSRWQLSSIQNYCLL